MKILRSIISLSLLITFSLSSTAQNNNLIRITNTQIITPDLVDMGTIDGQEKYVKLIIKNDRPNSVEICNIHTPQGFQVSINKKHLDPKSQTPLFIGVDPKLLTDTLVKEKIKIETNLILPIVINIQVRTPKH